MATLTALPSVSALGSVFIDNHCPFKVYGQSYTPEAPGPRLTFPPNTINAYHEHFRHSNTNRATFVFNTVPDLSRHLELAYNYDPNDQYGLVYYDMSTLSANPFLAQGFSLLGTDARSHDIHCPANQNRCPDVWNDSGNGPVFSTPNTGWLIVSLCKS
ncbi:MAG: hypothetical protein M1831_000704 [Alyxoria varia]|nr:MAG: hypothetical protein M1831_000704 [Alyxoria varia]